MLTMYKILERTIYYDNLEIKATRNKEVTHYGLFKINYHNDTLSSIDSEEPIGWWYESIDELVNDNPDVTIEKWVENYQQVLNDIHENWKKTLTND